ncbi:hypothetical protein HD806DRAFT_552859 [Xylariaceae sp. AK1471]|nr:hypothetical protein HD806DRAFT_552859 [Xylariaceae sp. AK1471]
MSNQGNRGRGNSRDFNAPWRPGTAVPAAGRAQMPAPVPAPAQNLPADNTNYRGDLSNPRNQSANIPEEENCATWWTNLPANCTYQMLFDSMRNVGAISHANINPPNGSHSTCAAKVELMDRASVERLWVQAQTRQIKVGGRVPTITMNRIRVPAQPNEHPPNQGNGGRGSRVLVVTGPPQIVRRDRLEAILGEGVNKVKYGLESANTSVLADGRHQIEFRFASYIVQAVRARGVFLAKKRSGDLNEEERALWEGVVCQFGPDPCE